MNFGGYFHLLVAVVLIVFAKQSNSLGVSICLNILGNGCQNSSSNEPVQTKPEIDQNYNNAKLALNTGYNDCVNSISTSQNKSMDALSAAEEFIFDNQSTDSACQTMRQLMQAALNDTYDGAVSQTQSLGDALALSNDDNTMQGLQEASQIVQRIGLELIAQMDASVSSVCQRINFGREPALKAINAARLAIQAAFAAIYDALQNSLQKATQSITDVQNMPPKSSIESRNTGTITRDPEALASVTKISDASKAAVQKGVNPNKVKKLNDSLVSLVGDFAQLTFDHEVCFNNAAKQADTDSSSAADELRKELDKLKERTQNIISKAFLIVSTPGVNKQGLARKQAGLAIRAIVQGDVEMSAGNKIAGDLTLLGLGLLKNVRSLVQKAALESLKSAEIAVLQRLTDAASISFDSL